MLITNRLLNQYYYAKKHWIGDNDYYNKTHFGILKREYGILSRVEQDALGIGGGRMTLKEAKKAYKNLTQ